LKASKSRIPAKESGFSFIRFERDRRSGVRSRKALRL
jgi:hypothetical protein